ncbi:hypothetical protein V2J09_004627 [Rumex salicifolius]
MLLFHFQKLFFFIIFFSSIWSESAVSESQQLKLWPKPRSFQWLNPNPSATLLSPSFTISAPPHRHLSAAVLRHRRLILTVPHEPITPYRLPISTSAPPLLSLKISISDLSAPLQHGANESYILTVLNSSASLVAPTVWGAMRGLETFSQLVWSSDSSALVVAVGLRIRDSPIFPHRGLLLDTSRNFYPVEDILRTIGAMSANKLNVFHWHITDSQSFPIVLPSEPNLAGKGSYGPRMQYSPKDVERIVQFGFDHGVRIMPEIDSPGHTGSWAAAYPEIMSCAGMFWWPAGTDWADRLASEPGSGQLNPLNPKTYKVMANIIKDMSSLFPENFFHSGADEVVPGCWKTDPSIQSYLSNGGTLSHLLEKFINSTLPLIVKNNKTAVYWEDVLLDRDIQARPSSLPKENVILQTWNGGPANTKCLVSSGYRTIVSSSDYYYLDCGHGGFVGNDSQYNGDTGSQGDGGSWCAPFKTWQRVYDYDIAEGLSGEERDLVVGGEAALWSEQADASVLDGRVWPRAAALAEALWSGNRDESGRKRYAEATDRLSEWRWRMVGRGVAAEPIQPLWCARNPGMCNTLNSS